MSKPHKKKPTDEQIALARFLIDEDNDGNSPLYNEVWNYQSSDNTDYYLHDILDGVSKNRRYISDASKELNEMIEYLNYKHDNYIKDNWK